MFEKAFKWYCISHCSNASDSKCSMNEDYINYIIIVSKHIKIVVTNNCISTFLYYYNMCWMHGIFLNFLKINAMTICMSPNLCFWSSSFQHCTFGFELTIIQHLRLFLHPYCISFSNMILFKYQFLAFLYLPDKSCPWWLIVVWWLVRGLVRWLVRWQGPVKIWGYTDVLDNRSKTKSGSV